MINTNEPFKKVTAYTDETPTYASNTSAMSNTNEKAQSAEELAEQHYRWKKANHGNPQYINYHSTIGDFKKGYEAAQSHISQLEHDLAKSQEKCKALEFSLVNTAVYWHAIEKESIPAYLIELAGGLSDKTKDDFLKAKDLTGVGQVEYTKDRLEELAEQALKPKE